MKILKFVTAFTVAAVLTVGLSGCLALSHPEVGKLERYSKSFPIIEKTDVESFIFSFGSNGTRYTVNAHIKNGTTLEEIYSIQETIMEDNVQASVKLRLVYNGVVFPTETPKATVAFLYETVNENVIDGEVTNSPFEGNDELYLSTISYIVKDRAHMVEQAEKLIVRSEVVNGKFEVSVGAPESFTATHVTTDSRSYAVLKELESFPKLVRFYIADSFVHVKLPAGASQGELAEVKAVIDEANLAYPEVDEDGYPWEIEVVIETP